MTESERFWSKVDKTSACWVWTAGRTTAGYGTFRAECGKVTAHRYAYEQKRGRVPPGALIRHRCDNPLCVRPGHLEVGYSEHNARDRQERGRTHNPALRLSAAKVRDIRRRAALGESQRAIGRRHGVSHSQVGRIVRGESWPDGPWP